LTAKGGTPTTAGGQGLKKQDWISLSKSNIEEEGKKGLRSSGQHGMR
jgi:hypothetical protein